MSLLTLLKTLGRFSNSLKVVIYQLGHKEADGFLLIINRYEAYIYHLSALAEDKAVKAVDRQRLKGYASRWIDGQVLLGCALC